jgi:hypothetical protein
MPSREFKRLMREIKQINTTYIKKEKNPEVSISHQQAKKTSIPAKKSIQKELVLPGIDKFGDVFKLDMSMSELDRFKGKVVHFNTDPSCALYYFGLQSPQNILRASSIIKSINNFWSDIEHSIIFPLSFSFKEMYKWEVEMAMCRSSFSCMYQRIILSLLMTLDYIKSTKQTSTYFELVVDLIAVISAIAIKISKDYGYQYDSNVFLREMQYLK